MISSKHSHGLEIENRNLFANVWRSNSACSPCEIRPKRTKSMAQLGRIILYLAITFAQVASVQLARLGLLPTQAKRAVHGGWRWTWEVRHWPWNVKSTIREAELPQHKPGSPWAHCRWPTTSQRYFYALHKLYLEISSQLHFFALHELYVLFFRTYPIPRTILRPWLCIP